MDKVEPDNVDIALDSVRNAARGWIDSVLTVDDVTYILRTVADELDGNRPREQELEHILTRIKERYDELMRDVESGKVEDGEVAVALIAIGHLAECALQSTNTVE